MLTEAAKQVLLDDGCITLDRCLDAKTVDALISGFKSTPHDLGEVRVKRGALFARRNILSTPLVQSFLGLTEVKTLIDELAPGTIPVRAILFDKTGDANWTVPWHQDRSIAVAERIDVPGFGPWSTKAGVVHVQPPVELLQSMLTLRFSLDTCDADNGPLRVIPGTHRALLDAASVDRAVATQPQRLCTTDAGGVVIMRPLTLHASSPAREARHRRVLHIEFGPPSLPGGLRWAMV